MDKAECEAFYDYKSRTILNVIDGFSYLLSRDDLTLKTRIEYQDIIRESSGELKKLVERLKEK